jgi:hypothetical protein
VLVVPLDQAEPCIWTTEYYLLLRVSGFTHFVILGPYYVDNG